MKRNDTGFNALRLISLSGSKLKLCVLERSGREVKKASHRVAEVTEIDQAEVLGGETQRDA